MRNKASKFAFVGESMEIETIEDLVGLFQDMFKSAGLSRQVSSSELSDQMLRSIVNMVRDCGIVDDYSQQSTYPL